MADNTATAFSNQGDYALICEFVKSLLRSDPFRRYGVHGVGVGRKEIMGKPTDLLAIRFHVPYKISPSQLLPERRIPPSFQYRSPVDDREVTFTTDVIESPPGRPQVDPGGVVRPVPGGVSCSGHGDLWPGAGTVGGWVWDNTDDTIVMLSNQHVFGDTAGTPILQPGAADGGIFPQDRIGAVKRSVPLMPAPPPGQEDYPADCNFVDAAVGELDDSANFDLTVLEIGPAVYEIDNPAIGMTVEKFGQTTDHTVGEITDLPYHTLVPYPVEGDVIMCDAFRFATNDPAEMPLSSMGDSGSLVFVQQPDDVIKPVVGLLFGGGTGANNFWSMACQISNVFAALDLGPLCIAGCAAFVDALYADAAEGADAGQLAAPDISPFVFNARERGRQRSRRFHTGLTLDLQKRIITGTRGRGLIRFVNRHRSELMALVVQDGDARRAIVAALRPILAGAITTDDVLAHRLSASETARLHALVALGDSKGSAELRKSLRVLAEMLDGAAGRSVGEVLGAK